MKERINVTIEEEVMDRVRKKGYNVSEITELALRKQMGLSPVNIPDERLGKCEFCGKEERKATRDDLNGLTWLCPDEKWICDACLDQKKRRLMRIAI